MTEEESRYLFEMIGKTVDTTKYGKIDKKVFYQVCRVVFKIGTLQSILKVYNIPYKIDISMADVEGLTELEKQFFIDTLVGDASGYGKDAGEVFKKAYKNNSQEM